MDRLQTILEPLLDERRRLQQDEAEAKEKLASIQEELRRTERVLRSGGLLQKDPAAKRPKVAAKKPYVVSPDKLERVAAWIRGHGVDRFTVNEINSSLKGIGPNSIEAAVGELRETGYVRLVGKFKGGLAYAATDALAQIEQGAFDAREAADAAADLLS